MALFFYLLFFVLAVIVLPIAAKKHGWALRPDWPKVGAVVSSPVFLLGLALLMRQMLRWGHTWEVYADVSVLLAFGAGCLLTLLVRSVLVAWAWLGGALGVTLLARDY